VSSVEPVPRRQTLEEWARLEGAGPSAPNMEE